MSRTELAGYLAVLESELPFVQKLERASRESLIVHTPRGEFPLTVELARSHLNRENAERLLAMRRRTPDLIVFAPHIGRDIAARFEDAKINFVDLAGNCNIQLGDSYFVRVQGRTARVDPSDKAMRAPAYRVLFALLADPSLANTTTRALAEASGGVSPQTARDVRARLADAGLLLQTRDAFRWAPGGTWRALEMWVAGYATTLFPQLLVARFRPREADPHALEARLEPLLTSYGQWAWGGGAACERLTGYYRGDRTMIYLAEKVASAELRRALQLVPDPSGPLTFAVAPGPRAFGAAARCAHPLLVYTDLLQEGNDRAREAAEEVRERFLTFGDARR